MKKKIIAFILCACLICTTCIPAYAVGAEGIIIGGGAAAAGITLTMPQVALIIAAGYGLIFAVQHADDIAALLDEALTSAASAVENGIDKLTEWKNNALKGDIAIASAPSFVDDTIKDWATLFYEGGYNTVEPFPYITVPKNTYFNSSHLWGGGNVSCTQEVKALRAGKITTSVINGIEYYNLTSYLVVVSFNPFSSYNFGDTSEHSSSINLGQTVHYMKQYTATTIRKDNIAGNNAIAYEAVSNLVSKCDYSVLEAINPDKKWYENIITAWYNSTYGENESICADVTVGGLGNAAEEHGIDNITLPDINVGESDLLIPDVEADQSIDDVISDTLTKLKNQEMEWTDYINDVAVGTPSVSIPQEDGTVSDFPITDVGVGDVPLDIPADVTNPLGPYSIDLTQYFPFCIPFDVVRFVNILCAEPEAPSFEWEFTWFDGSKDSLVIDLSPFDTVAQLLRNMEILLFIIGLALITREQIRG